MDPRVNSFGRSFYSGVALSEDIRSFIIDEICVLGGDRSTYYTPVGTIAAVSRKSKVSQATVKKVWIRFCDTFLASRKPTGGAQNARCKLQPADLELIEVIKKYQGSTSLKEIHAILEEKGIVGGDISLSAISRALKSRMQSGKKYTRKKMTQISLQRFTYNNMLYTQLFIDYLSTKAPHRLKFFDASGIKVPDVGRRLYGHAPVGERCVELVKKCESPNATLNLMASLNGAEFYDVVDGATNTLKFLEFFERAANSLNLETMRPCLEVGDIVIMDNLSVHHYEGGEILEEFLEEMGIELLFTPVYSPDLNPVELFQQNKDGVKL